MRKRIISVLLILCVLSATGMTAYADGLPLRTVDMPGSMCFVRSYPNEGNECIEAVYTVPDDLCAVAGASAELQQKLYGTAILSCVQFDWAVDDEAAFHYDQSWDTTENDSPIHPIEGNFVEQSEVFWFAYERDVARCGDGVRRQRTQLPAADGEQPQSADVYSFDFDRHTLYVRARFFIYDTGSGECLFSEWTQPLNVAENFATGVKLSKKNTDAPILTKASAVGDGTFGFDLGFTDEFKETARVLKSAYATELNLESQVRVDNGEWTYWILSDELYPYRVGARQFTVSSEDADKKIEFRCRLTGGNPDFGTDVTTGWSDIFTSENGKVRIAVNDDPFDEKVQQAEREAAEKEAKKCKLCGFCPIHPFGVCMFIWLGILALIALVVWYILRKKKQKKAEEAAIAARRAASAADGTDKTKSFVLTDSISLRTTDRPEDGGETPEAAEETPETAEETPETKEEDTTDEAKEQDDES